MKILLIEDDELIAQTLENILRDHDYVVDRAAEGELGWRFIEAYNYDLILLDIILPKLNGIELCRRLRSAGDLTPVMLLTAQNSNNKKIIGLDAGADDYVVKPFEISELLARIRVLLRRKNSLTLPILEWEDLRLDSRTHETTYRGKLLNLTPKEYRLLELFLRNGDRVLTRSVILDSLWSVDEAPTENAVMAHIKDLRRKLKQVGANTNLIETIYGVGYRLKSIATNTNSPAPSQKPDLTKRQKLESSLASLWQKFEGLNNQRLEILERANRAWQDDTLEAELLQQAKWSAHRLAGGLGVFGFAEGSRLAIEIEDLLRVQETSEPERASYFSELLLALKNSLKLDRDLQPALTEQNSPLILAIDDCSQLVARVLAEMSAANIGFELVSNQANLKQALDKPDLDVVIWDFALSGLTAVELNDFAGLVNEILPTLVILLTNNDNLSDRLKFVRLFEQKNLLLQQSALSKQAIVSLVKAIKRIKHKEAKVLLVDDDAEVLEFIRSVIKPWNLDLTTLENPRQFWQAIAKLDPDLLILDVAMPESDGIELCQLVRNDPRWRELPILFFTVHSDRRTMYRVLAAGANDFVSKTIPQTELVTKIFNHLNRSQLLRAIQY
ncbi:response regulator [Myxosarcina sp. GI1(2024)]